MKVLNQWIDSRGWTEARHQEALVEGYGFDRGCAGQTEAERFVNLSQQPPQMRDEIVEGRRLAHRTVAGNDALDVELVLATRKGIDVLAWAAFEQHGVAD